MKRSLAASAYNERHSECAQAVAVVVVMSSPRTTVLCARITGAGFGGCTVNLVHKGAVSLLNERVTKELQARFGITPGVHVLERNVEAGRVSAPEESTSRGRS